MAEPSVKVLNRDNGVVLLTLNEPKNMNAWNENVEFELFEAFNKLDSDPECRVIVVSAEGRFFCVGADPRGMNVGTEEIRQERLAKRANWKINKICDVSKMRTPVIAAMNGGCAGIGFSFALACDIRFAAKGAKIGCTFPQRGLVAEDGMAHFLPQLVGTGNAMMLLLSGEAMPAEDLPPGLIQKVVSPANAILKETLDFADKLGKNSSPTAMAVIKRQIYIMPRKPLEEAQEINDKIQESSIWDGNTERTEGFASLVEHRSANFTSFNPQLPFVKLAKELLGAEWDMSMPGASG